jgi:hypothetical protein
MIQEIKSSIKNRKYKTKPKKIEAEKYTGIYSMHKYWSKKPANLIRDLILKYSKETEIVLDCFCGSGVSIVESIQTGRKAVGIDINPAAIFITRQILEKVEPSRLTDEFQKIKIDCEPIINDLYKVRRKNGTVIGTHFIWSGDKLKEIWHLKGSKKIIFKPKVSDIKLAKSFSYEKIPYYYPKTKLFSHPKINTRADMRVCDLFTPRNTLTLSLLLRSIHSYTMNTIIRR